MGSAPSYGTGILKSVNSNYSGFWSYVHLDDKAEHGRITLLAKDLCEQYEMISGNSIQLFLDQEDLEWGDKWREKIDDSLFSTAFFIPVITPRYFNSSACRAELQYFMGRMKEAGLLRLVMPIHYVNTPILGANSISDDLVQEISDTQWVDWRELRFEDRSSSSYRRAIMSMAERLYEANEVIESDLPRSNLFHENSNEGFDSAPGTLDLMADAEDAMPKWTRAIEEITPFIAEIGEIFQVGTTELGSQQVKSAGFGGKVRVLRGVAAELDAPVSQIEIHAEAFRMQLHSIDLGLREMIAAIVVEAKQDVIAMERGNAFLAQLNSLVESSNRGLGSLEGMLEKAAPLEKMSRDLRRPLNRLRQSLSSLIEGREIINSWQVELKDGLENLELKTII